MRSLGERNISLFMSISTYDTLGLSSIVKIWIPSLSLKVYASVYVVKRPEEIDNIIHIYSGHTRELVNSNFSTFSTTEGISHAFSAPITPHENGVVKMKNRTLHEMTIVMVHVNKISILVLG